MTSLPTAGPAPGNETPRPGTLELAGLSLGVRAQRARVAVPVAFGVALAHLALRLLPAPLPLIVDSVELVVLSVLVVVRPSSPFRTILSAWMLVLIVPIAQVIGRDGFPAPIAQLVGASAVALAAVFAVRGPWGLARHRFALSLDRTIAPQAALLAVAVLLAAIAVALGMRPAPLLAGAAGGDRLVAGLTAVVGGSAGEVLFRGVLLFAVLGLVRSVPISALGTALLAAAAGAVPGASLGMLVLSTLLGLAAGLVAARTSSVTGAIAAHALYFGLVAVA